MSEQQQQVTSGEFYAEPYVPMEMGAYEAAVARIVTPEQPGPYGPQFEWYFTILDPDYEGQEVKAFSSRAFSPSAKARLWVQAILGRDVQEGERINFSELTGKRVTLHIGHNKTERGTFEKVEGLSPIRKGRRQQAEAQAEAPAQPAQPAQQQVQVDGPQPGEDGPDPDKPPF